MRARADELSTLEEKQNYGLVQDCWWGAAEVIDAGRSNWVNGERDGL
jgi:hypothetical protein